MNGCDDRRRGTLELALVLLVFIPALAVTVITYWRLPPGGTYNFWLTGAHGAVSRTIVELNYPVALAAIAVAFVWARRLPGRWPWVAAVAALLCATLGLPGVVSQDNLAASARNLPAAAGAVVLGGSAVWLVVSAWPPRWARSRSAADPWRIVIAVVMLVYAIPWIVALGGFYASDLPLLGRVVEAAQPTPGERNLPDVHRGLHEGLAGTQLVLTALLLSRCLGLVQGVWLRTAASLYLSLMFAYGLLVAAGDGWNEQLVKRGAVSFMLPDVLQPSVGWGWLWVLLLTLGIHLAWFGRERIRSTPCAETTTAAAR